MPKHQGACAKPQIEAEAGGQGSAGSADAPGAGAGADVAASAGAATTGWRLDDDGAAEAVGVTETTVRAVRRRYREEGLTAALHERPRPGAVRRLTEKQSSEVVAGCALLHPPALGARHAGITPTSVAALPISSARWSPRRDGIS